MAAAILCYIAVQFRMGRDWDDALDVWGVHGVGGSLRVILTGVFASTYLKIGGLGDTLPGIFPIYIGGGGPQAHDYSE